MNLFLSWFKIGLFTFGGGYAMLPLIQKEIVDEKKWATEDEVITYYTLGQFLPGIIAVNTATLVGYKQAKIKGAFMATLGLITPSIILITLFSLGLGSLMEESWMINILNGIKIGVSVLMVVTLMKLWGKSIQDRVQFSIFLLIILLLLFFNIPILVLLFLSIVLAEISYGVKMIKEKSL